MKPGLLAAAGMVCVTVSACGGTGVPARDSHPVASTTTPTDEGYVLPSSSGATTAAPNAFDATRACQQSVPPGSTSLLAAATTVGEVRDFRAGPPGPTGEPAAMWPDAFPGANPTDPAAWCTAVYTNGVAAYYVVSPGQPVLDLGRESGLTEPPPPGPPRIE